MSVRCHALPVTACAADAAPALALAVGAAASARGRRGVRVRCLAGMVWTTRSGDPRDHVLRAGDTLDAGAGVRIAVQAVEASQVRFTVVD